MTEWLTGMKTAVRSSTHATYTTLVDTHIKKNLGSVRLQDLTAARLNALYSDLLTKGRANGKGGLSPATVRYVHSVIRKALSDAMKENLITRNVADAARVPRVSRPQIRTWSAREVRTFLNHVARGPVCTPPMSSPARPACGEERSSGCAGGISISKVDAFLSLSR